MEKLVVLKIDGEVDRGFGVTLEISFENDSLVAEAIGSLPMAANLVKQYENWHSTYRRLDYSHRIQLQNDPKETETNSYFLRLRQECQKSAENLKNLLNTWLDFPGLRHINKELFANLNSDDEVRFLIATDSVSLRKLPWHLWNILELYPKAEIALSALEGQKPPLSNNFTEEINILAIVGNGEGIDDNPALEEFYQNLPNAKVTLLKEPEYRELNDLWERPWDILFFAGHGTTEGRRGRMYINRTHTPDSITTDEIESAVKRAIDNGLQLAIFNCCDALGLAHQLEKLHIPQTIAMREAIPDKVAYKFFIDFLFQFVKGENLYASVRSARSKLTELENDYPCTSWLPVIYQNPAMTPPTWNGLIEQKLRDRERVPADSSTPETNLPEESENSKSNSQELPEKIATIAATQLLLWEGNHLKYRRVKPERQRMWLALLGIPLASIVFFGLLSWLRARESFVPSLNPQSKTVSTFREVEEVPSGMFDYGGSTTWAPIREQVDPVIKFVWPEFNLRYTQHPIIPPGSVTGIRMLLNGQLTIAQSSRPLKTEEYEQARKQNFTLKQVPIAMDAIAIAVNHDLGIPGLTVNQLQDIYSGKINNWKEVGGPDREIVPYSRSPKAGGTVEFFMDNVLDDKEFGASVQIVSTTTEGLRSVAKNPSAIYYASAIELVKQCTIETLPIGRDAKEYVPPYALPIVPPQECPGRRNQINHHAFLTGTYPITRNLYAIVKQNGEIEEKAGEAYVNLLLSDQGQDLIDKAGFVRIR